MRMNRIFVSAILFICTYMIGKADATYQAEEAKVIFHGAVETEHGGTGSGYVNLDNETGSYVELIFVMADSGNQTLTITYAYEAEPIRSMDLTINSVSEGSLNFPATGAWTTWNTYNVDINLKEGSNIVRLTSSTANGGPNLDKFDVTGEQGSVNTYVLNLNTYGTGVINGATNGEYFEEGTSVSLSAVPGPNESFGGWRGGINSSEPTINFNINDDLTVNAIFIPEGYSKKMNEKIGWCDYNQITTGGEGGTEVTVTNLSELKSYINKSGKYIIKVKGEIHSDTYEKMDVGSDKSIIGDTTGAIISGCGFRIKDANSVIVKYILFKDAFVTWGGETTDNDAIEVNNSTHVWIDHCAFTHYDDGLIDIKNASDYVTVSWCHFYNHNKVMLIGAGEGDTQDIGHLNVTVHHCWFDGSVGNGVGVRLPMGRFGKIHAFNNYYTDIITRCVEANYDADMVVENNYFLNSEMPHALVGSAGDNKLNASGNVYINSGTRRDNTGTAFTPLVYYYYELDDANIVPNIVMLGAGIVYEPEIGNSGTNIISNYTFPNNAILEQNYPNPFENETIIGFYLPEKIYVNLNIISSNGTLIQNLVNKELSQGKHYVNFNSEKLTPGMYFYQLNAKNTRTLTKIMIVK